MADTNRWPMLRTALDGEIHGGDGMQGDPCNQDHLYSTEWIANERREMAGGTDHEAFRGYARAMAVPKHTVLDKVTGTLATLRKEKIQMEIEEQQALGSDGLLGEDCHLGECNLGDLEDTLGIKETYWLLAIKAAREAGRLEALRTQTNQINCIGTTT